MMEQMQSLQNLFSNFCSESMFSNGADGNIFNVGVVVQLDKNLYIFSRL